MKSMFILMNSTNVSVTIDLVNLDSTVLNSEDFTPSSVITQSRAIARNVTILTGINPALLGVSQDILMHDKKSIMSSG